MDRRTVDPHRRRRHRTKQHGEKQFRFGEAEAEFLMELTLRCADLSRKVTLADTKQLYGKYSPEPFVVFYHSKQWDQLRKYGLLQI